MQAFWNVPRQRTAMTAPDRIYLDYNATAPLRPSVRSRVIALMDRTGNASSVHAEGRFARAVIERARAEIAGWPTSPPTR